MSELLKIYNTFGFNASIKVHRPCSLYIDTIPNFSKLQREDFDSKKILMLIEPLGLMVNREYALNTSEFDYILTHDKYVLEKQSNAILHEFGTCRIKDFEFKPKEHCITTLIGGKNLFPNHLLRKELLYLKNINFPLRIDFFNSKNFPVDVLDLPSMKDSSKKNELFYSEYHICIENTTEDNWFTEKIIDCFQTKTIPIYCGCPNINNWFNRDGMFTFNSINDLIPIIKSLTPETYSQMAQAIDDNFERSKQFVDFESMLTKKIRLLDL